jgi:hypothetical protein
MNDNVQNDAVTSGSSQIIPRKNNYFKNDLDKIKMMSHDHSSIDFGTNDSLKLRQPGILSGQKDFREVELTIPESRSIIIPPRDSSNNDYQGLESDQKISSTNESSKNTTSLKSFSLNGSWSRE